MPADYSRKDIFNTDTTLLPLASNKYVFSKFGTDKVNDLAAVTSGIMDSFHV
jgi:hypothetical protein